MEESAYIGGVIAGLAFFIAGFRLVRLSVRTGEAPERLLGATFLVWKTLGILVLGAFAFGFSTFGGVVFAKLLNAFLPEGKKINPCIGAAGVSAVPMSARVVQRVVSDDTDGLVNPLMAAMGPNVAGVIGSAAAAGMFLALLG